MEKYKSKRNKPNIQEKPKISKPVDTDAELGPRSKVSLLDQHSELKKKAEGIIVISVERCYCILCSI